MVLAVPRVLICAIVIVRGKRRALGLVRQRKFLLSQAAKVRLVGGQQLDLAENEDIIERVETRK